MDAMASQITGVSIVYTTVCSGAEQRRHQSSASLAFVRGIPRWPVNSPHKGPVTRKMFLFHYVIMGYGPSGHGVYLIYASILFTRVLAWGYRFIDTLRPRQDDRHFAYDISLYENCFSLIQISMKSVPNVRPINSMPVLVKEMAWHRSGDRPSTEPMMALCTDACKRTSASTSWYSAPLAFCTHMMTSSNGSIFCVTGLLCGEFTGHRWTPHTKTSDAELWCFLWSAPE